MAFCTAAVYIYTSNAGDSITATVEPTPTGCTLAGSNPGDIEPYLFSLHDGLNNHAATTATVTGPSGRVTFYGKPDGSDGAAHSVFLSSSFRISVTLQGPTTQNCSATVPYGTPTHIGLSGFPGDYATGGFGGTGDGVNQAFTCGGIAPPLTFFALFQPSFGTFNNGTGIYTPNPGYSGPDSFPFVCIDGIHVGNSNTSICSITVEPLAPPFPNPPAPPDPPAFAPDFLPVPVQSLIVPSQGVLAGGTRVTILGTNFQLGCTVTIGAALATDVRFVSSTEINCLTPANAAGTLPVTVTNPDFTMCTAVLNFLYDNTNFTGLLFFNPNKASWHDSYNGGVEKKIPSPTVRTAYIGE